MTRSTTEKDERRLWVNVEELGALTVELLNLRAQAGQASVRLEDLQERSTAYQMNMSLTLEDLVKKMEPYVKDRAPTRDDLQKLLWVASWVEKMIQPMLIVKYDEGEGPL